MAPIRIGSRKSTLARIQSELVRGALIKAHRLSSGDVEIITYTTPADKHKDRPLHEIGGKDVFVRDIEQALADGEIDLAVHSAKDMPGDQHSGLNIAAALPRAAAADIFISPVARSLAELPRGARLGTSSPRRCAMVLHERPDIQIIPFRGNVPTRLAKLDKGEVDATILAQAGLERLSLLDRIKGHISQLSFIPAVGQGTIIIQIRDGDSRILPLAAAIDHTPSMQCFTAERRYLSCLGGDCHSPIGGIAELVGGEAHFRAAILSLDGQYCYQEEEFGTIDQLNLMADRLAKRLLSQAGPQFFLSSAPHPQPQII